MPLLLFFFFFPSSGEEDDKEQRIHRRAKTVKKKLKDEDLCQAWDALLVGNKVLHFSVLSKHANFLFLHNQNKLKTYTKIFNIP